MANARPVSTIRSMHQHLRTLRTEPLALFGLSMVFGTALATAPAAQAGGVATFDGTTTVITGTAAGDELFISRDFDGTLSVRGATAGAGCSTLDPEQYPTRCPIGSGGVRISALGGNDKVNWNDWAEELLPRELVQIDLGDGNDTYWTSQVDGPATVRGGAGNDELEGSRQGDDLDGGPGMDKLRGIQGDDILRGGDGDDQLAGDSTDDRGADLIDGGAGRDSVDDWGASEWRASITMDGIANDGFPDERDNVIGVEQIRVGAGLDFSGDDGENHITAGEVATTNAILVGRGGDDTLVGTDRSDQIDGGIGNDTLTGGYGNDTITGGPGQDTIMGDRPGRCNEMHCDLSPGSAADTIDVVDGEVDIISCGPGNDVVRADAADRVDPDCEQVTRASVPAGGGSGTGGSTPGTGGATAGGAGSPFEVKTTTLGTALSKGIKVRLSGLKAGKKVIVTAKSGGATIGSGSAKASKAGAATVTVRLTKAGRRRLAGKKIARITLRAGGLSQKVTLRT